MNRSRNPGNLADRMEGHLHRYARLLRRSAAKAPAPEKAAMIIDHAEQVEADLERFRQWRKPTPVSIRTQ